MLYLGLLALGASASPTVTCDPNDPAKCSCNGVPIGPHTWTPPTWLVTNKTSIYQTSAYLKGALTPLSTLRAKATLMVNVASAWGLQNLNYPGIKTLLARYNSSGFQVMAFPCNQFGAQAPCSSDCERAYMYHKVGLPPSAFTVFDKGVVNGPGTMEPYTVAKNQAKQGHDAGFDVMWNYEKFVVDSEGTPVARFASDADPMDAEPLIRKLLGQSA